MRRALTAALVLTLTVPWSSAATAAPPKSASSKTLSATKRAQYVQLLQTLAAAPPPSSSLRKRFQLISGHLKANEAKQVQSALASLVHVIAKQERAALAKSKLAPSKKTELLRGKTRARTLALLHGAIQQSLIDPVKALKGKGLELNSLKQKGFKLQRAAQNARGQYKAAKSKVARSKLQRKIDSLEARMKAAEKDRHLTELKLHEAMQQYTKMFELIASVVKYSQDTVDGVIKNLKA